MHDQPAFGGMLQQLVSLGALEFRPEPLDAIVEERLKTTWEQAACPECGAAAITTWESLDRIRCRGCGFMSTYTLGTPFYQAELSPGEFLIAFVLYGDTLLCINQIAPLLERAYNTIHGAIRDVEAAFLRGFPLVWARIAHTLAGPTQVDEMQQTCAGFKGKDPPREGLSRGGTPQAGRSRWRGEQGDELTVVAACRDVLRVISAEEGTRFDDELKPVLDETAALSTPLEAVWTDEHPPYTAMEHTHETVVHDEGYVSPAGVHTNQVECLWSLLDPWLAKFRGLSKDGLERAARTFGFLRSLTLVGAPLHSLVDCLAPEVVRQSA